MCDTIDLAVEVIHLPTVSAAGTSEARGKGPGSAELLGQRDDDPRGAADVAEPVAVLGPATAPEARDLLGPLIEAGATWWDERRPIDDEVDRLEPVLRRIEAGPPIL